MLVRPLNSAPAPMLASPRHRLPLLPPPTAPLNPLLAMATAPRSNSPLATLTLSNNNLLQDTALLPLGTSLQMPMVPLREEFQA